MPFPGENERKQLKLASTIQRELNDIVQKEISDPRIGFITFTGVKITPDRKKVTVKVSPMGNAQQQDESLAGLANASGFIRRLLGKRLQLRVAPEITFARDDNPAFNVEKILKEISDDTEGNGQ